MALAEPGDKREVGHQWVLDQWQHWAKVPTFQRFCVVAPNYLELDKVATLDEMVWGVFGERGWVQRGNEPNWLAPPETDLLEDYPPHPPASDTYLDWLQDAMRTGTKCKRLLPAMGCWKGSSADDSTKVAWSRYLGQVDFYVEPIVCANIYPWSNDTSVTNQLASMRRQIRIAKAVAEILEAELIITEIGRTGGKPVSHLCQGVDHYVWGAGIGDKYDLPGTEPVVKP